MKLPHTLQSLRASGRDPLGLLRADEVLAVDAGWLARVASGAPVGFWDEDDAPAARAKTPYTIVNGVAVYDISGPLSQRGWMCLPGYDTIARDLQAALDDSAVRSVLLRMNTPGGAASGCFEAVQQMRAAVEASGKRVVAFSDESCYSAGYAIACIADEIVVPEPGGVGSVGVISSMVSWAKANETEGVDFRLFVSGAEKGDGVPNVPISDGAAARAQARVEQLASIFARWVAARRGMTPESVRALEAGVRYGADAVSAGLADRVASYPATLAALAAASPTPGTENAMAMTEDEKKIHDVGSAMLTMVGAKAPDEGLPSLAAMKQAAARAVELATENTQLRATVAAAEKKADASARAEVLADGMRTGKISKAMADDPEWMAMVDGFSLGQIKTFVGKLPAQVPAAGPTRPAKASTARDAAARATAARGGEAVELTAEEIQAANIARVPLEKARAAKALRLARTAASSGAQLPGDDDDEDEEEV